VFVDRETSLQRDEQYQLAFHADLHLRELLIGLERLTLSGRFILEDILQPKLNCRSRGTRGVDPAGVDVPRSVVVEKAGVGMRKLG